MGARKWERGVYAKKLVRQNYVETSGKGDRETK